MHSYTVFTFVFIVATIVERTQSTELELKGTNAYVDPTTGATWYSQISGERHHLEHNQRSFGAIRETAAEKLKRPTAFRNLPNDLNELPKHFDAREHWSFCPSIGRISDQSSCISDWAIAAVDAMTDRLCIHSKGAFNKTLSANDVLSCCDFCGFGCTGGISGKVWDFWQYYGIVTGGSLESPSGCRSYPFPRCAHHHSHQNSTKYKPCPKKIYSTPECRKSCDTPDIDYNTDKTYGANMYNVDQNQKAIMMEIFLNGPVEGVITVFQDFLSYKSGVYFHAHGRRRGDQAVRILGWGEENGVPYWLVANSWNESWGEKGFFRIVRGRNECEIENDVSAGLPKPMVV